MKKIIVFAWISIFCLGVTANRLITFPVCKDIPQNHDFTVKVRVPGKQWVDLYSYEVLVDAHKVQKSSMVMFDFEGSIELAVISNRVKINSARIRPLSQDIPFEISGDTLFFELEKPMDISVEINEDIYHNLQLFTNSPETIKPKRNDPNVVYFPAGFHQMDSLTLKSGQKLYLEGGAVLKSRIVCDKVRDVEIFGRGIVYQGQRGVEIKYSSNVSVSDIIFINPTHYTIFGGQSNHLNIKGIRSFSSRGWSDGIDLMSCSDVFIEDVFMRNSDDCIAIYGHRWDFYGDSRNVEVRNAVLWADVAHPIMIGTHGNAAPGKLEVIENLLFTNIDILNHDEPQINYQGCLAINVSDENLVRNIRFENIRIEDFQQGQLFNLRVTFNKKYATAPGRGIENVLFKDIQYKGKSPQISIIEGYAADRSIKHIVFENLNINGIEISPRMVKPGHMKFADFAKIYEGLYVENVQFISTTENK